MSVIKAGTTLTTAYTVEADTTGALEFKTGPSATLAMSISASGVVTFPATTGFDIASANITNLTSTTSTITDLRATTASATVLRSASGTITNLLATSLAVSGIAEFPDGSVTAPSITNTGDTNTGIYYPAADEVAISTGGSAGAAFNSNGLFFRNRIINGDMRIDQRNNGASVTVNSSSAPYCPDRWNSRVQQASGAFTVQRSTTVPTGAGFNNSVFLTVTNTTAAGSTNRVHIRQIIEGYNIADLGWGTASALTITLSFWVRSSVTGTYGVGFINSSETRSYVGTYVVNSANTWEKKSITVPGDTSGTWETGDSNGIRVTFDLGSGSSYNASSANTWVAQEAARTSSCVNWQQNSGATLYLTGVQLETGSVATPFERRPYGVEFLLCQRYYQENIGETGAANEMLPFTMNDGVAFTPNNYRWIALSWPVEMRATPTVTFYPDGGSKANPGNATYLTGTGSGAGNKLAPYGIALSPKMGTLKSYNEYAAFTCYGVVAGYSASAEL